MSTAQNGSLGFAERFTDLVVYQKSRVLSREVFVLTKRFPKEEAFSLTDQWRRAVRSIGAQISEAWAKRRYPKHFASKLTDADGEQMESQHWTITAFDDEYITRDEAAKLGGMAKEIGRMLGEMIAKAESFDGTDANRFREDSSSYFVNLQPDESFPPPIPAD